VEDQTINLELIIDGDESVATEVLEARDVDVTRPKPTRFIVEAGAVIGLAAGLVKLVGALVDLANKLRKNPQAPEVVARNVDGNRLLLNQATDEEIAAFVHSSAEETA
jgi:hypothetical protein